MMLIQHYLERSALITPRKTAIVCKGLRHTYGEIDENANRFANLLIEAGVRCGDRVLILLENSIETVVAIFGTLKAGGVFVVLHSGTKPWRLVQVLEDAEPKALVTTAATAAAESTVVSRESSLRCVVMVDDSQEAAGSVPFFRWSELRSYPSSRPSAATIDIDLAALIYTSGSTGSPKAVMIRHTNMLAASASVNSYLRNTAEDVILNVMPMAFSYGLYQILLAFQVGGTVVLERNFAFPARIISTIEKENVTGLPGVPTLFAILLRYSKLLERGFPSLRYITNAGAALSIAQIRRLREAFPNSQVFSMYGLTECKRVSYLPPELIDYKPSSVGIAIPNTEAYVVDDNGKRLGPGLIGELVVRGSHVAPGYWRAPELTAKRFWDGDLPGERLLHTGDLFRTDAEGFLYFVGRKDELIKSRGEKISPCEIETVLNRMNTVSAAAVVGVPDELLGQAILAAVEPKDGSALTEQAVRSHCVENLLGFMVPKYIQIVRELPRTSNGKIDKTALLHDTRNVWNCGSIQSSEPREAEPHRPL